VTERRKDGTNMTIKQIPSLLHTFLFLAIAALLTACGPKAETTPEPETPETETVEDEGDEEEVVADDEMGEDEDEEDEEEE